jgi:hypothetical protein
MQSREKLIENMVHGFIRYCDAVESTQEAARLLADDLSDELAFAADNRDGCRRQVEASDTGS